MYLSLVTPNLTATATPGNCLAYVQRVLGAPVAHPSATWAWQNAGGQHPGEAPPEAVVPLWFAHFGSYGPSWPLPYHYGNWGHVAVYVPGDAIYTSPANPNAGSSFERYGTIAEIERAFNATYVGWSEYLNGKQIVAVIPDTPPPPPPENEDLMSVLYARATGNSSPITPGDPGTSRIWAGDDRKIGGVTYSGVWAIPDDAPARRLTAAEWRIVEGAYAKIDRPVPLALVGGNDLEIIMHGPQAAKPRP